MNNPHVSVIMPVYNAGEYLKEAIQSVIDQTFTEWELHIVNDGSKDGSKEIIQSFKDERIIYHEQNNKGVSEARNVGLRHMKGDFFCFLDADDCMPNGSLKERLKVFDKNADTYFVDGKVNVYDKKLSRIIREWEPSFIGNPLEDLLSLTGKSFLGNTWMIKRQPGKDYHFKGELTHGEDLLFYINLARSGQQYNSTKEVVLNYRTGLNSAMTNLKGLENGYRSILHEIDNMEDIPLDLKTKYLKKAKNIIFKSYLGNFQPLNALFSFLKKW